MEQTDQELLIEAAGSSVFLKEFLFTKNEFKVEGVGESELADAIVRCDPYLFLLQAKQRVKTEADSAGWFKKKVLGEAVGQLAESAKMLRSSPAPKVVNGRGDAVEFSGLDPDSARKIAIYGASGGLPAAQSGLKCYLSIRAGLVHLFEQSDFIRVIQLLFGLSEIDEYLEFRAGVAQRWPDETLALSEDSILGCYVMGPEIRLPAVGDEQQVVRLLAEHRGSQFKEKLLVFTDKLIDPSNTGTQHHLILAEFAKLNRSELSKVEEYFSLAVAEAYKGSVVKPYGVHFPRADLSVIFAPMPETEPEEMALLAAYTRLYKYKTKAGKCIGASIIRRPSYFNIHWAYVREVWKQDLEAEKNMPFEGLRSSSSATVQRYPEAM